MPRPDGVLGTTGTRHALGEQGQQGGVIVDAGVLWMSICAAHLMTFLRYFNYQHKHLNISTAAHYTEGKGSQMAIICSSYSTSSAWLS